jgi:hypothetical protein
LLPYKNIKYLNIEKIKSCSYIRKLFRSFRIALIYLIAAATKIEENEAEMEILLDDAGGGGGIPTSSAITAIGAGILGCFIIAACCVLWCKK